jgi:hypothetical protein
LSFPNVQNVLSKVNIDPKNYLLVDETAADPDEEGQRYEQRSKDLGGINY